MNVENPSKEKKRWMDGRRKKRWMDCVKNEMRIKGVSMEMTSDRRAQKKKKKANL
jgi:hypothetical protein